MADLTNSQRRSGAFDGWKKLEHVAFRNGHGVSELGTLRFSVPKASMTWYESLRWWLALEACLQDEEKGKQTISRAFNGIYESEHCVIPVLKTTGG